MKVSNLVRPNILALKPYSSARNEFTGNASVFLDANENPYNNGVNRYPDPLQHEVKESLSAIKGVSAKQIFLGNGSDEAIDLVYRIFCNPGVDNVVAIAPTYGMYEVCADINDVAYRSVPLKEGFQIDIPALLKAVDPYTKVMWICSPNNPTGNSMRREDIVYLLDNFGGIIVVDEAYIDFSMQGTMLDLLAAYPRLIVLQTFSKAWGMAAIRLGIAYASEEIIGYFNKVKYPYNVNILTQKQALEAMSQREKKEEEVKVILEQRKLLEDSLPQLLCVEKVYPSDANFVLAKVTDANSLYKYLTGLGIIVRNRNSVQLCGNCLRLTIGTPEENVELMKALAKF